MSRKKKLRVAIAPSWAFFFLFCLTKYIDLTYAILEDLLNLQFSKVSTETAHSQHITQAVTQSILFC
uniref:Putative secreted protein n=1 Tax=Ixodes ricinus TaxID=34613 RepID=A0A6B0U0C2_IXORI